MPEEPGDRRGTQCVPAPLRQPAPEGLSQGSLETGFRGGVITSNGGVTLLSRADERLDLTRRVAACFTDYRHPRLVVHDVEIPVFQRLYGLALGYEDLNDHEELRRDPALQAVAGRVTPRRGDCAPLAGKSTLKLLDRLRAAWPATRIILRTDSGFCREPVLAACERRENVDYVVGIAKNARDPAGP